MITSPIELLIFQQKEKECWINVYSDGKKQWHGYCYSILKVPQLSRKVKILYRIHVRLK